jgi:hypothetical protein
MEHETHGVVTLAASTDRSSLIIGIAVAASGFVIRELHERRKAANSHDFEHEWEPES